MPFDISFQSIIMKNIVANTTQHNRFHQKSSKNSDSIVRRGLSK